MGYDNKKQDKKRFYRPRQISELIGGLVDPLLQQRAGMTMQLVLAWEDIVGATHAEYSRPEKLEWPRQISEDDAFMPATLKIACDGARSIYLQHEAGLIIERINGFFGFGAIDRIRIVQKPIRVQDKPRRKPPQQLSQAQQTRLSEMLEGVEDEKLRAALKKMGEGVLGSSND